MDEDDLVLIGCGCMILSALVMVLLSVIGLATVLG